jgi:hypothetical protein
MLSFEHDNAAHCSRKEEQRIGVKNPRQRTAAPESAFVSV